MNFNFFNNQITFGDSQNSYANWEHPVAIISDGPYGIDGYQGDFKNASELANFYKPHIQMWSKFSIPQTTLWFWNTELGWANVHQEIQNNGWIFKGCNIWDKGIAHIAGNCNGKTMKKFPVVTEVCVQYVRKEGFKIKDGLEKSVQQWLREEWKKTGLPFSHANTACGVKNAASRKYLAKDHLWYFPPAEEFIKMVEYANEFGLKNNKPYFSLDGKNSICCSQWERLRAKFNFEYGLTNVWYHPTLKSNQRLKLENIYHPSEKPLLLLERIIKASTDEGDMIWEPFAGTGAASYAAFCLNRKFSCAEINYEYFELLKKRFEKHYKF